MADRKLNISDAYLTPGLLLRRLVPAQGPARAGARGPRARTSTCRSSRACSPSNEAHFRRTYELLTANGRRRIGLFGLSFKPGTDELRESPLVELAERLIGKGYDLRIYDPTIHLPSLTGANREYIEEHLPHLKQLLAETADEVRRARRDVRRRVARRRGRTRARRRRRPADRRPRPPPATPPSSSGNSEYHGVAW